MVKIRIKKKDLIWSYIAQFFNLGVGFITLPLILKTLNPDEIGLNYILISISSVIALFDMGFSTQIAKNITYVLSGAQKIEKDGISSEYRETVNERLLACIFITAKRIYNRISFIALIPLTTIGSYYVWTITADGSAIDHLWLIWLVFCLSCFFNLYFLYYNSYLQGRGFVKEAKKGQILSKIVQITILSTFLITGFGLLSVVVANLIAPFAFRIYSRKIFYDEYTKSILNRYVVTRPEVKETFLILFYNAKKMGIIGILASALGYASTLIVGAFLPLTEVGSYGVMIQLLGIIGGLSSILFYSMSPELSQYVVKKDLILLRERFGLAIFIFYIIQVLGFIVMIAAQYLFRIFDFNAQLPSITIVLLFCVYKLIEQNQSLFCQLLVIENNMIFYTSALWTGIISIVLQLILLYLGYGLYGVLLSYVIPLCAYSAWKWPLYTSKKYKISFRTDIILHSVRLINWNYNKYIDRIWKCH